MTFKKWVIATLVMINCLSWSMVAQTPEDSVYTVQIPKGYQIPAERLDSMVVLTPVDKTTELVFTATDIPSFHQLNFDTTMSVEIEEIVDDLGYADFATDALIVDRLACLQNEVPLNYHSRVKAFINYFAVKDRSFTLRVMQRKNLYFPIYERVLAEYGMPDELKYLSIIESALVPVARSRARAVGLWQFMAATGRMYGLKQDYYIDERMDPEKSTVAACRYLKSLHEMFNDWELAIAAYNCGPGNIRKAMRRSGYKKTFWEIFPKLPRETRSYLPQLVAMIYVMNHAEELNLVQDQPFYPIPTAKVVVNQFVDLGTLAKEIKVCEEDLRLLNPELKKAAVPAYATNYALKIPQKRLNYFLSNKEAILKKVSTSHTYDPYAVSNGGTYKKPNKYYHVVRSGESLGLIAQRSGVGVYALKEWNNLSSNQIHAGQRLVIYSKGRKTSNSSKSSSSLTQTNTQKAVTYHRVRYGEVLGSIARRYGTSVAKLQAWNNLKDNGIYAGQKLRVKAPTAAQSTIAGTAKYHIVKSGESLSVIASKYAVGVSSIKSWNGLTSNRLKVGQRLLIRTKDKPITYKKKTNTAPIKGAKYHVVRRGETLSTIAVRYNVSISDLQRWNNLNGTRINSGQKLVLKATSTATKTSSASNKNVQASSTGTYIVKSGDSLWTIAQAHNITVAKLKSLNGLRSSRLQVGQKLRVK